MQGGIVITDRYPSEQMDGARIIPKSRLTRFLSKLERKNYVAMPCPDLIIKVTAPLEITLHRNSLRKIPEPEPFVRHRYELARKIEFPYTDVVEIDTTLSQTESLRKVQEVIWNRSING